MKAAVLNNINQPLAIKNNITFNKLKRGQVLVEITYSGVCHSQLMEVRGKRGEDKWLPHLLGREATGIVRKVGSDVSKVKIGNKVVLGWIKGTGIDAEGAICNSQDKKIIALDIEKSKLKLEKEFGATHTINSKIEDVNEKIKELISGIGLDYSDKATGLVKKIEIAFKNVKNNGGLYISASHPQNGDLINIDPFDLICGKQIKGSWGGSCNPDKDLLKFFSLCIDGKLPLERLLEKIYTLDQINEALDNLENRLVIRPLIQINPNLEK